MSARALAGYLGVLVVDSTVWVRWLLGVFAVKEKSPEGQHQLRRLILSKSGVTMAESMLRNEDVPTPKETPIVEEEMVTAIREAMEEAPITAMLLLTWAAEITGGLNVASMRSPS